MDTSMFFILEFKQFIINDAINNVSFEIRKNGQKAYQFKKEELNRLIKKQESRIRKKYRFKKYKSTNNIK